MAEEHPYVPRDLHLPGFVPGTLSPTYIVGVYISASLLVISLVWFFSGRVKSRLSKTDRVLMCWWAFTGLTHIFIEGTFVFQPKFYMDKTSGYFSEVWKEYSKGDSRYVARDAAIVAVEGITVVLEGPFSLLTVYAIAKKASYSYILQIIISVGQLYGTAVYFITAILEGDNFASSTYHYYAYYVFANSFWVWIPTLIIIRAWRKICAASPVHVPIQKKTKKR